MPVVSNFLKRHWSDASRQDKCFILVGLLSMPVGAAAMYFAISYAKATTQAEMGPLPLISLQTPYKDKTYAEFCKGYPAGFERKVYAPDQTFAKIRCPAKSPE